MQDQTMSGNDDCSKWHSLEADASAEAAKHLPSPAGWVEIREAVAQALTNLGCVGVRQHRVRFDPDMWQLDAVALPEHVLDSKQVSRGDGFDIASEPATSSANWQLFCTSFVFGYGTYGVGPARLRRILEWTKPEQLCEIIAEARRRLDACGPLSAYDYLRGSKRRRVPYWGPAFFTKLLYLAGAPGEARGALILDNQTAWMVAKLSSMEHFVNKRNQSERWTTWRYGVYIAWMRMVAQQCRVHPDVLEYALFSEAKRRGRRPPRSR
jgi:hypothetical protein